MVSSDSPSHLSQVLVVRLGKQRDFVTSVVGQCVGLHHGDRLYAGVSISLIMGPPDSCHYHGWPVKP